MRPKTIAFIQARMSSTRFPGKVLKPISQLLPPYEITGHNWTVLDMVCARVQCATFVDVLVVITSDNPNDDAIAQHCAKAGYMCFRGSEENVMSRLMEASSMFECEIIVDVTADCPLVDPTHIDRIITRLIENQLDYCSNVIVRSWPDGLDVQVYTREAFRKLFAGEYGPVNPEHTGYNFIINMGNGLLHYENIPAPPEYRHPDWELTVDWPEDLDLIRLLVDVEYLKNSSDDFRLPWDFSIESIIDFIAQHPGLLRMNMGLHRKPASNPAAQEAKI